MLYWRTTYKSNFTYNYLLIGGQSNTRQFSLEIFRLRKSLGKDKLRLRWLTLGVSARSKSSPLLLKIILWKASVDVYGFEELQRANSRATPDFDQLLMSIFIGELSSRLSLHHGTALHVQIPFLFYISSPLPNWFTSGLQCLLLICFFRQLGSLSINQPLATGINKSKKRPKNLEWWGVFFVSGFYYDTVGMIRIWWLFECPFMAGLKCIVDLFYCLVSPSCEQNRQEFRSSSIKTVLKVLPLKFKGKYRRGGFLHDGQWWGSSFDWSAGGKK